MLKTLWVSHSQLHEMKAQGITVAGRHRDHDVESKFRIWTNGTSFGWQVSPPPGAAVSY
ncbi:MAG: hypothetical protein ABJC12_07225 [Saprospiraceae bacterium]